MWKETEVKNKFRTPLITWHIFCPYDDDVIPVLLLFVLCTAVSTRRSELWSSTRYWGAESHGSDTERDEYWILVCVCVCVCVCVVWGVCVWGGGVTSQWSCFVLRQQLTITPDNKPYIVRIRFIFFHFPTNISVTWPTQWLRHDLSVVTIPVIHNFLVLTFYSLHLFASDIY